MLLQNFRHNRHSPYRFLSAVSIQDNRMSRARNRKVLHLAFFWCYCFHWLSGQLIKRRTLVFGVKVPTISIQINCGWGVTCFSTFINPLLVFISDSPCTIALYSFSIYKIVGGVAWFHTLILRLCIPAGSLNRVGMPNCNLPSSLMLKVPSTAISISSGCGRLSCLLNSTTTKWLSVFQNGGKKPHVRYAGYSSCCRAIFHNRPDTKSMFEQRLWC